MRESITWDFYPFGRSCGEAFRPIFLFPSLKCLSDLNLIHFLIEAPATPMMTIDFRYESLVTSPEIDGSFFPSPRIMQKGKFLCFQTYPYPLECIRTFVLQFLNVTITLCAYNSFYLTCYNFNIRVIPK